MHLNNSSDFLIHVCMATQSAFWYLSEHKTGVCYLFKLLNCPMIIDKTPDCNVFTRDLQGHCTIEWRRSRGGGRRVEEEKGRGGKERRNREGKVEGEG